MHPKDNTDQARQLREMAQGHLPSLNPPRPERPIPQGVTVRPVRPRSPRGIMLGELPNVQFSLSLAYLLAIELGSVAEPCLVVDLSPCASRLPQIIDELQQHFPRDSGPPAIQPLWYQSTHGRTPGLSTRPGSTDIDILAQPSGEYPNADQMQRMCEQLIRQLQNPNAAGHFYHNVIFTSSAEGIPMDSVCWQTADEVLLIWSPEHTSDQQLQAALTSRLSGDNEQQSLRLLRNRPSLLGPLSPMRRPLRPVTCARPQHSYAKLAAPFDRAPQFETTLAPPRANKLRLLAVQRVARKLAKQLGRLPADSRTRQAS